MGGSSAINSMLYIRGHQRDYDEWAAMGNKGWSYKEVFDEKYHIAIFNKNFMSSTGIAKIFHDNTGLIFFEPGTKP